MTTATGLDRYIETAEFDELVHALAYYGRGSHEWETIHHAIDARIATRYAIDAISAGRTWTEIHPQHVIVIADDASTIA
ncbi:hypothetical protein [Rhodococcus sp. 11-3]|uniref:hypothetical protein n=1 Tax=Rhodococcus sp. 11-3 TaxID=2854796 RepID=UPI002040DE4A|nr:hypothetical protein [Rhodococcus sp. 11-3]USC17021.1 hypothetical protein KZJ41_09210 [Rhodococcus sp. 11-3]